MTGLLRIKLGRDFRTGWSRFVLMTIAVTVSLAVFGGVFFAWTAVSRETRSAYASTEPASATIVLDQRLTLAELSEVLSEVRERSGVVEAAGRTQFNTDVKVNGEGRDLPMQVFVVPPEDPLRIARFFLDRGSWPPPSTGIALNGDSLGLIDTELGDTVTVTSPTGDATELEVTDTVYDPSLAPSPQEQRARGYIATTAIAAPDDPVIDQLKIQIADHDTQTPSRDREFIAAAAAEIGRWLREDRGLVVREIQVPEPYTHPHQFQADTLLLSLLAGGAAALLLSAILVANMLNTLFIQQIPQIGIMKAVGARAGRIGLFYLTMTVLVSIIATLLAIGPAILIGRAGVQQFLAFLGVEPASLEPASWAYLVVIALGVGLPPLMAAVPLFRTSRITVRQAMDHHGMGAEPSKTTGLLARLGRWNRLDRGLLLALRNTVRRPARFWLSVGLLAVAGVVFVAGMSLSASVQALADEQRQQTTWDVNVQTVGLVPIQKALARAEETPDVTRVEAWVNVSTGIAGVGEIPITRTYPDQGHGRMALTAIPDNATTFTPPKLIEGRWLRPGETDAVVLNQIALKNTVPDLTIGDNVQLFIGDEATTWQVVGVVEERASRGIVYTTVDGFADKLGRPPVTNQLRVFTGDHDEQTRNTVASSVVQQLGDGGIEVNSAVSVSRSEAITEGHLGPVILIIVAISVAMGLVGTIGLASTMSANVLDRTREFGIMHAIGAQPKRVRRIVIAEGIFLGFTSVIVAILPALALTAGFAAGLGNLFMDAPLPFRISTLAVAIWIVVVIVGAVIATDAAANRASRITVRQALAYL